MANLHSQIRIWNIFHMARPLCLPILSRMGNWAMKRSDTKLWFQLIIIMTIRPQGFFFIYIYIDHLVRYMAEVCSPLERKSMAVSWAAHRSIPAGIQSRWAVHAQRTAPNETNSNKYRPKCTLDLLCVLFSFRENKRKMHFFFPVQEVCLINYRHRSGKGEAHNTQGTWPWIFCLLLFFNLCVQTSVARPRHLKGRGNLLDANKQMFDLCSCSLSAGRQTLGHDRAGVAMAYRESVKAWIS